MGIDRKSGAGRSQVTRHLAVTLGVSALLATIFTAWKPASLDPGEVVEQLIAFAEDRPSQVSGPVDPPPQDPGGPLQVAVVAGHTGLHPDTGIEDPGAVCPDGLTEVQLNDQVAGLVVEGLKAAGLEAVKMEEFDSRLVGFRGLALVSLHADSCDPINEQATGFKVSTAVDTATPDRSQRLVSCLVDRYGRATGLKYNANSVTLDMTEYHTFYEIHNQTPAAIIEMGFLYLDRDYLMGNTNEVARGVLEGVLCYVNNEPIELPLEVSP